MLNLSTILEYSAKNFPNKDAFIFLDKRLSFSQIDILSNQVASALLTKGIVKGDKVALSCPNLPYFPIIYYGILKAGAIVVPLSVLLKQDEVAYHLEDSDAKALFSFVDTPTLPLLKENYNGFKKVDSCKDLFIITNTFEDSSPIDGIETLGSLLSKGNSNFDTVITNPDDTAVIIYTSGTTGKPKGAELSHSNLLLNTMICSDLIGTNKDDTQIVVLPLFHIFAMVALMNVGVYKAATSVLVPRFDVKTVLDLIVKHAVSVFAGVPTMYWAIVNYNSDNYKVSDINKSLRICVSGGASLPVKVLEDFEEKFNTIILEGYGMSEGSPVITFNQKEFGRKPGSIGTPVWGVEVKIVDENDKEVPIGEKGEIIYRGHNVMKGYYNKPEANKKTIKNGWLYSGDVGIKDKDGFFFIVDRTKDMIIRGGLNVYPREVEEVIMRHPAISMVAIIGVPDEKFGEEIKACVVLKDNEELSEDELISWTKENIAAYKYPRVIEFMAALPLSATGKILKKELRK